MAFYRGTSSSTPVESQPEVEDETSETKKGLPLETLLSSKTGQMGIGAAIVLVVLAQIFQMFTPLISTVPAEIKIEVIQNRKAIERLTTVQQTAIDKLTELQVTSIKNETKIITLLERLDRKE